MFCPKCSQEQVSDETRFCSRCGFPLNAVKALLADEEGGTGTGAVKQGHIKQDVTIGAGFMFAVALLIAAFTVTMPPAHSSRILLLLIAFPLLVLVINIKPIFQYFTKRGSASDEPTVDRPASISSGPRQALPHSQSVPANIYIPRAPDTANMSGSPSVAEGTTNLLNNS